MKTTNREKTKADILSQIDSLQVWFAGHKSTDAGWADRERLEADLIERLAMLEE
jgi:hypothetical protein